MLTASIICPHCEKADLASFAELHEYGDRAFVDERTAAQTAEFEVKHRSPSVTIEPNTSGQGSRPVADDILPVAGLLICQACYRPMLALLEMTRVELLNHKKNLQKIGTGKANRRFTMDEMTILPGRQEIEVHPAWPERVQELMPDLDRMLQQRFQPSVCITTARTIIDICMKDLEGQGRDIFGRINDLLEKGVITKPIAAWAHEVRLLGRDATHDAEGSREDAEELTRFIHFFLQAAYELAADIERRAIPASLS